MGLYLLIPVEGQFSLDKCVAFLCDNSPILLKFFLQNVGIQFLLLKETLCEIWYHLYNLENLQNTYAGGLILVFFFIFFKGMGVNILTFYFFNFTLEVHN